MDINRKKIDRLKNLVAFAYRNQGYLALHTEEPLWFYLEILKLFGIKDKDKPNKNREIKLRARDKRFKEIKGKVWGKES